MRNVSADDFHWLLATDRGSEAEARNLEPNRLSAKL
jgi:hypothetical protein